MSSIIKDLRQAYECLYDNNGNKRVYIKKSLGVSLNKDKINLLYKILDYIFNHSVVCEYTKYYIKNKYMSTRMVADQFNIENDREVINKIMYDKRKLSSQLGSQFIFDIMFKEIDIKYYEDKVNEILIRKEINEEYKSRLAITVSNDSVKDNYDGDFVEDYKEILYTYSKERIRIIQSALNKDIDFVGYFNYIMSSLCENDEKALRDRDRILAILDNKVIAENSTVDNTFSKDKETNSDDDLEI